MFQSHYQVIFDTLDEDYVFLTVISDSCSLYMNCIDAIVTA